MDSREAIQMARVDGIDDGYRRGVADTIKAFCLIPSIVNVDTSISEKLRQFTARHVEREIALNEAREAAARLCALVQELFDFTTPVNDVEKFSALASVMAESGWWRRAKIALGHNGEDGYRCDKCGKYECLYERKEDEL